MEKQKLPFRKHIFVCVNRREEGSASCDPRGGSQIRDCLKQYVKDHGLKGKVRVSQSGCMDLCAQGPNVMVFPDNAWYSGVKVDDLPALIEEVLTDKAGK